MKCDNCGCNIDGEPYRVFARNLDGEEEWIADICLCSDGVNSDSMCRSSGLRVIADAAKSIKNMEPMKTVKRFF